MPHSGIAFVRRLPGAHHSPVPINKAQELEIMRAFVKNVGFALAAVVVVVGLGATFEYQPVINALAR
jgi:hypothetical protein